MSEVFLDQEYFSGVRAGVDVVNSSLDNFLEVISAFYGF
jgi:hypothetical protein